MGPAELNTACQVRNDPLTFANLSRVQNQKDYQARELMDYN